MPKRAKHERTGRSLSSLDRKPRGKKPRKTVLIVCEGSTEKVYFEALKRHLDLARVVDIDIVDEGGSPISVVERALKLIAKRKREAKRSYFVLPYDESWCIIDVENPANNSSFNSAVHKADSQIDPLWLAVSNPAFEYWFVLHFEFTSRSFHDGQEVKQYFRNYIADYEEGQDIFPALVDNLTTAIERAERVMRDCFDDERYPHPCTLVFCLVNRLQQMAVHFQEEQSVMCQKAFPSV